MWRKEEIPKGSIALARRRLEGLMHTSIIQTETLERILCAAYFQGLTDAIDVMNEQKIEVKNG